MREGKNALPKHSGNLIFPPWSRLEDDIFHDDMEFVRGYDIFFLHVFFVWQEE